MNEPREDGGAAMGTAEEFWLRWDHLKEREWFVVLSMAVVLALFPWVLVRSPVVSDLLQGYQGLAVLILIWGVFALGFDLLLGYTGLLSFGHAVFWGGGAYAAGYFSANVIGSPILMVIVAMVAAVLLAWVIGFISLRRGGIYFAVLTLAFGQMMYFLFLSPLGEYTGGEDGFTGVVINDLFGQIRLSSAPPMFLEPLLGNYLYVFTAVVALAAIAAAYRIINSPYGLVFAAIRENETRAEFVGLNVWRYKLMAFIISGAIAGLAGGLFVIYQAYVPLNSLYWTASGDVVVMTVLGGTGSLFGPIIGAGVFMWVKNIVVTFPIVGPYWHMVLGVVFVLVVWFFPDGTWGILDEIRALFRGNSEGRS